MKIVEGDPNGSKWCAEEVPSHNDEFGHVDSLLMALPLLMIMSGVYQVYHLPRSSQELHTSLRPKKGPSNRPSGTGELMVEGCLVERLRLKTLGFPGPKNKPQSCDQPVLTAFWSTLEHT